MKTKPDFTASEARIIKDCLKQKVQAGRYEQKVLRQRIRKLGFFISEFVQPGKAFSCGDFDQLVAAGAISITQDSAQAQINRTKSRKSPAPRPDSDEAYVVDLCDRVLGQNALRQHRFAFLLGDTGARLPVDAYYPELNLVVEYHELQHTDEVPLFDRRTTVSGISRGLQRRLYDQRRQAVLPEHGIDVVVLSYDEFLHSPQKRLKRDEQQDLAVIRTRLAAWL